MLGDGVFRPGSLHFPFLDLRLVPRWREDDDGLDISEEAVLPIGDVGDGDSDVNQRALQLLLVVAGRNTITVQIENRKRFSEELPGRDKLIKLPTDVVVATRPVAHVERCRKIIYTYVNNDP